MVVRCTGQAWYGYEVTDYLETVPQKEDKDQAEEQTAKGGDNLELLQGPPLRAIADPMVHHLGTPVEAIANPGDRTSVNRPTHPLHLWRQKVTNTIRHMN